MKPASRQWHRVLLLCVVGMMINSCGSAKKGIAAINRAIDALNKQSEAWLKESGEWRGESAQWRGTLSDLEHDLINEGLPKMAYHAKLISDRTIATGGAEIRCTMDFVGHRLIGALNEMLQVLEEDGEEPPPPVPHYCNVSPAEVDVRRIKSGDLITLGFYGYDMFQDRAGDLGVRVLLMNRDGSSEDITFAAHFETHYFMSIRVNDSRILYTGESDRLVVVDRYSKSLSEIPIISGLPTNFDWCQGSVPPRLGLDTGQSCFLTRMTGRFRGATEWIDTYVSNDSWYLGGASGQIDVCASAMCLSGHAKLNDFSWTAGKPPVRMERVQNNACFLTQIRGRFQALTDSVEIIESDGYYYLRGGSQPVGEASARCVGNVQEAISFDWAKGQTPKPLGTESKWACFFTKVAGQFESKGDAVRVYAQNTSWYLDGFSQNAGVSASVKCIAR